MGPGYFPTVLSILMIGLGAVIAVQALRRPPEGASFSQIPWLGLLLLIGAVLFFGFVVRDLRSSAPPPYCFIGVLLGTAVGVLPGLGPVATIAMLLPITFGLPPVSSLIMLAGIYYGAQYGGSTTAILINLPGESSSVVTAIDGYQMAKKGRAGRRSPPPRWAPSSPARWRPWSWPLFAPPLAGCGAQFGPAEYFSLMVLGLVASVALASGSLLKAFTMIVLGLLLGPGRQRRRDRHPALHLRHAGDGRRAELRGAQHGRVRPRARSCATWSTSIPAASWSSTSAA